MNVEVLGAQGLRYQEMYAVLERGQGRQMALCQEVLRKGADFYCEILARDNAAAVEYSPEREGINQVLRAASNLHSCMIDTDRAVEEAAIE